MEYPRSLINRWTHRTIASVIEVHKQLGPGLLESVYQRCLQRELTRAGVAFRANHTVDVIYRDEKIDAGLKLDLLVAGLVVVELKSVQELAPVHEAQILTYLKLSGAPVGLLINFNVPVVSKGVRRFLNKDHVLVDRFDPLRNERPTRSNIAASQPDPKVPCPLCLRGGEDK